MNPTGSSRSDEELLAKIRSLPPDKAAEVEDFVDFLSQAWATAGCRALRRGCPKRPSDGSGTTPRTTSKRRSAAIVSSDPYHERRPDVLILAITSQSSEPDALAPGPIRDWRDAGLLRKSVLKPIVATLQRELVLRRLGRLAEDDRALLREMLSAMLGLRGA